jgi:hypothetical protein
MLAYMFSYCASHPRHVLHANISLYHLPDGIAAGATLSLLNYILLGFTFPIDGYYLRSFEVWLACMVVFPGAGNLGFSILEYRLGQKNLVCVSFFFLALLARVYN